MNKENKVNDIKHDYNHIVVWTEQNETYFSWLNAQIMNQSTRDIVQHNFPVASLTFQGPKPKIVRSSQRYSKFSTILRYDDSLSSWNFL